MQIWIQEHEIDADTFSLAARSLGAAPLTSSVQLAERLRPALALLPGCATTEISDRELVVSSAGAQSVWRLSDEGAEARFEVGGEADPTVRFIERAALSIAPGEVRLRGARQGRSVDTGWLPFDPAGLLFSRTTWSRQSAFQRIEIGEHPVYGRVLFLDGENQIADSDEPLYSGTFARIGLTPEVRRVCVLGGGDCGVLRELLRSDHVEAVDMIELDREVVTTCEAHFPEVVGDSLRDPRSRLRFEDAFAFLERSPPVYDLILYDLSDTPITGISFTEIVDLMVSALGPRGRIVAQCGSTLPQYDALREGFLDALRAHFHHVQLHEASIPSFNELTWLFAEAAQRRGA